VEGIGFQFVCAGCLATRGVLEAPELPEVCPACGLRDPWTGPFEGSRFERRDPAGLVESPFYLAAFGAGRQRGMSG